MDNVLYQSGLSLSRSNAKQLISHRHVLVNGKILNIASHQLKNGDTVTLDKSTISKLGDTFRLSDKDFKSPQWLNLTKNKYTVSLAADPSSEDFNQGIDVNLIIEYYSR